jgi:3-hydroxy-3-methylglutaryl CoA synthase
VSPLGSIFRCGAHVPKLRLSHTVIADAMAWAMPPGRTKPRGARAVCNWDEDALTMAVEAGRDCLSSDSSTPGSSDPPQALVFCSTTAPFADRDDAVMLCGALDLPETVDTLNVAASLRAGTRGLLTALRQSDRLRTLVVASDARLARPGSAEEMTYGDAAVALLVGPSGSGSLATVLAARSIGSDFVDHYRMSDTRFDYALEERWVRDESLLKLIPRVVAELLDEAHCPAQSVKYFLVPAGAGTANRIAQACGLGSAQRNTDVLNQCGNTGAAMPLLMLGAALETAQPGDLIVLLGIGQGIDGVLLRAESGARGRKPSVRQALDRKCDELSYVRYLSHRRLLDVDFGMRAERDQRTAHTVAYRKHDALSAFKGGRCGACGTVQFPQSRVCVNPECRQTDTQSAHRLAESMGRVKTFTEDWQAYAPRPPYVYGNVEFNEGGNLLMEFTDVDSGELKVNDAVRFVFRIKDDDRARCFRRYFWKATKA